MFQNNPKLEVKVELTHGLRELCRQNKEIRMISLNTSDGFPIKSLASKELTTEADKIAAMASTIFSLGNSSINEFFGDDVVVTTIESDTGTLLFVGTTYLQTDCVLVLGVNASMSLAMARYLALRMAEKISGF